MTDNSPYNPISRLRSLKLVTVKIVSNGYKRLPVISSGDVPKDMVSEVIKFLDTVEVKAPVKVKDVVVENVLGLGVDIVATRTIEE